MDTSLTSTASLPGSTQPQYSSFNDVSKRFRRIQNSGDYGSRPAKPVDLGRTSSFATAYKNTLASFKPPQIDGILVPKNMVAAGTFVVNPTQTLSTDSVALEGRARSRYGVVRAESNQSLDNARMRAMGVSAYKSQFK